MKLFEVILGRGDRVIICADSSINLLMDTDKFKQDIAHSFNSMQIYVQQEFTKIYSGVYDDSHLPWLNERLDGFLQNLLSLDNVISKALKELISNMKPCWKVTSEDIICIEIDKDLKGLNFKFNPAYIENNKENEEVIGSLYDIVKRSTGEFFAIYGFSSINELTIKNMHHAINEKITLERMNPLNRKLNTFLNYIESKVQNGEGYDNRK